MKVIKKFNILSVAKISGILYGGLYLILVLVINIIDFLFDISSFKNFDILGFGSGILVIFLLAIFVGVFSFVVGMIIAWLYNVSANIVGGISWEETEVTQNSSFNFKKKEKILETIRPQDEINNILTKPEKEKEDTFSSNNK